MRGDTRWEAFVGPSGSSVVELSTIVERDRDGQPVLVGEEPTGLVCDARTPEEAHLLSSAPDLLQACKDALADLETWHGESHSRTDYHGEQHYDPCDGCSTCQETIPALQAAIAKAESRSEEQRQDSP